MRNRAKCKLCNSIIESFHAGDYVECKCGEIGVQGGQGLYCSSRNWDNFIRVDDNGNEIIVKVKDKNEAIPKSKPDRNELLDMLDAMIKDIERLPNHAQTAPITHMDLSAALLLLLELFRADC